jgi:hypothetical protein
MYRHCHYELKFFSDHLNVEKFRIQWIQLRTVRYWWEVGRAKD